MSRTYILMNRTILTERQEQQKIALRIKDAYLFFRKYCKRRKQPASTKNRKKIFRPIPNHRENCPGKKEHTKFRKIYFQN